MKRMQSGHPIGGFGTPRPIRYFSAAVPLDRRAFSTDFGDRGGFAQRLARVTLLLTLSLQLRCFSIALPPFFLLGRFFAIFGQTNELPRALEYFGCCAVLPCEPVREQIQLVAANAR